MRNKYSKVYILNYLNNLTPMIWIVTQSDGINRVLKKFHCKTYSYLKFLVYKTSGSFFFSLVVILLLK